MTTTRTQKWIVGILSIITLLTVAVYLFEWNMLRGFVERRVTDSTDRSFHINGDLDVDLSWRPRIPLSFEKVHTANADVQFKGKQIKTMPLPIDDMTVHLKLDDGRLTLDPLNYAVVDGDIRATINLDANQSPINTDADIKLRKIRIDQLRSVDELSKRHVKPTPIAELMSYTSQVSQPKLVVSF